jgi:hypothetical protein
MCPVRTAFYVRALKSQSKKHSPAPMMMMIGSVGMYHRSAEGAENFRNDANIKNK